MIVFDLLTKYLNFKNIYIKVRKKHFCFGKTMLLL